MVKINDLKEFTIYCRRVLKKLIKGSDKIAQKTALKFYINIKNGVLKKRYRESTRLHILFPTFK